MEEKCRTEWRFQPAPPANQALLPGCSIYLAVIEPRKTNFSKATPARHRAGCRFSHSLVLRNGISSLEREYALSNSRRISVRPAARAASMISS